MKTFLVRGVPHSIQRDGWWMDGPIGRHPAPEDQSAATPRGWERAALLLALIALADLLLWGTAPGLSLALFGICLLLTALSLADGRGRGGFVLGVVFMLPLIEQVQALSVLFWAAGLLIGGAWIALGGWAGLSRTAIAALRLLGHGPLQILRDAAARGARAGGGQRISEHLSGTLVGWTLPVGLGLVFLSLLIQANPVFEAWLEQLNHLRAPEISRILFWAGLTLAIWPFLRLTALRTRLTAPLMDPVIGPRRPPALFNADAVRRSLILFNLLFAVQTGMDAVYLWGGASLPEGMRYATYAHRGAYPLLATALLAGAFALAARPFTDTDRLMRLALTLWIAQTMLLVFSSILRLELYIGVYGLTRLRLAAVIWMAVVATGLGLTLWHVLRCHSTGWLLKRCAVLGLATLYGCMFFSFDRAIAHNHLTDDRIVADSRYICTLGSAALPEIRQHAPGLCDQYLGPYVPYKVDWREWGFRDWRILRSLAALNEAVPGAEL